MRRRLGLLLAVPPVLVAGVLAFGAFYLRHKPFSIPAEFRYGEAAERPALTLRYLGVAGYEVSDGKTVVLVDPAVTRTTLLGRLLGPLRSDEALSRRMCPRADYILIKHAHFDHIVDMPEIARRTGAVVVGTRSALNLALARGVPPEKTILARPGEEIRLGTFRVAVRAYKHAPVLGIDEFLVGTIPEDAGELWWWQYRQDGSLSYRLDNGSASIWFAGPSTFDEPGVEPADTLVMGIAAQRFDAARLKRIFAAARPKRLFPAHYDNLFQPMSKGLSLLPEVDLGRLRDLVAEAAPGLPLYLLDYGESATLNADR